MERFWKYIYNTFLIETQGSYRKAYILGLDHDSKLEGKSTIGEIMSIYTFYHPLWLNFSQKYNSWMEIKAIYRSFTTIVENNLLNLATVLSAKWEATILSFYPKTSPEYRLFLPNGRKPLYKGPYDIRMPYLNALIENIGVNPNLQVIKTEMINVRDELVATRNQQQNKEILVKDASLQLEQARVTLAEAMYKNLANLMAYYYQTPENIAIFFDLSLIRNVPKEEDTELFRGEIAPGSQDIIVYSEIGFSEDTRFIFKNTGTVDYSVYTMPTQHEDPAGLGIIIPPDSERVLSASQIGAITNKALLLRNVNTNTDALYQIIGINIPNNLD